MSDTSLYETDLTLWSEAQGRLLRAAAASRRNEPIDWDHLAEEIESLGRSERNEVASLVRSILGHLLKLANSPAAAPRRGWTITVAQARVDLHDRLRTSPSLRRTLPSVIENAWPSAAKIAALELEQFLEFDAAQRTRDARDPFSVEDVLGDGV